MPAGDLSIPRLRFLVEKPPNYRTGSSYVDRHCNLYGSPYALPAPRLAEDSLRRLVHPPVTLGDLEGGLVRKTIGEVCQHRGWELLVADVRTNHLHAVLRAPCPPSQVMNAFKSWSTRRIVEAGHRPSHGRLWVRHGSTRSLWHPAAVDAACRYVAEEQGLPTYVLSAP